MLSDALSVEGFAKSSTAEIFVQHMFVAVMATIFHNPPLLLYQQIIKCCRYIYIGIAFFISINNFRPKQIMANVSTCNSKVNTVSVVISYSTITIHYSNSMH